MCWKASQAHICWLPNDETHDASQQMKLQIKGSMTVANLHVAVRQHMPSVTGVYVHKRSNFFFLPASRLRNQVITACPKMFGTGIDSFFPSLRMSHLHESCICWMTNAKWEVAEFPRKMWQIPSQLEKNSSFVFLEFEWFKSIGSKGTKKTPLPPVTWRYRDLECVECNTLSWVVLVTNILPFQRQITAR